jgi:hypothetical protein
VPRYSLWQPPITSRHIRLLPSVRGMVLGPHPSFVVVEGSEGPCGGLVPLPKADSTIPKSGKAECSPGGHAERIPCP